VTSDCRYEGFVKEYLLKVQLVQMIMYQSTPGIMLMQFVFHMWA